VDDEMTSQTDQASQVTRKRDARQAGVLYLLFAVAAIVNEFFFPTFMVSGDATATARNITAGELAYRTDIMGGFVVHIIFIILVVSLYNLFREVDRKQAMFMVLMVSLGVAIALVNLLNKFAPLIFLNGDEYLSIFTQPQLEALALGFLRLHSSGANLAIAFWGLWLFPFGILVMRSGFIPKIFGILLIVAGVGYFVTSFTAIVLPELRPVLSPFIMPLYLGELPIIFWLAIKGVNVQKMEARALQTDGV
jgi:hypothetical protein